MPVGPGQTVTVNTSLAQYTSKGKFMSKFQLKLSNGGTQELVIYGDIVSLEHKFEMSPYNRCDGCCMCSIF